MNFESTITEVNSFLIGNTLTTVTTTTIILQPNASEVSHCVAGYTLPLTIVAAEPTTVESAITEVDQVIPVKKKRLTAAKRQELCEEFGFSFFQEVTSQKPRTLEDLDILVASFKKRYIQPCQVEHSNAHINAFIDKNIKRNISTLRRDIIQAQKEAQQQALLYRRFVEKRKRLSKKRRRLAKLKAKALANPRKVTEKNPALRMKLQHELEVLKESVKVLGRLLQAGTGNEDRHYAKILAYLSEIKVIEYRLG